jgi:hypothetical protein
VIGHLGIDPEKALWMTPREIEAASEGYGRRVRERTVLHPMSDFKSERQARQFINGTSRATLPPEEQEQKLDQLKDRLSR